MENSQICFFILAIIIFAGIYLCTGNNGQKNELVSSKSSFVPFFSTDYLSRKNESFTLTSKLAPKGFPRSIDKIYEKYKNGEPLNYWERKVLLAHKKWWNRMFIESDTTSRIKPILNQNMNNPYYYPKILRSGIDSKTGECLGGMCILQTPEFINMLNDRVPISRKI